jgi:hypothetical protein
MKTFKVFLFGVAFMLLGGTLIPNGAWAKIHQLCCGITVIIEDTLSCPSFPSPYPNPSNDGLHFHFYNSFQGQVEIKATDANGNSVYEKTVNISGGEEVVLPTDTWENGVYTITVNTDACTRRIVAEVYR